MHNSRLNTVNVKGALLEVTTRETENGISVSVQGRLDSSSAPELSEALEPVISVGDATVVLDLSATEYVSSAGLRVLLATTKRLKAAGRTFILCGVSSRIMEVIKVTGLDRVLDIRGTVEEALEGIP